ncbi:hypothetical protein CSUI_007552, partial [Cystoisospora suis]
FPSFFLSAWSPRGYVWRDPVGERQLSLRRFFFLGDGRPRLLQLLFLSTLPKKLKE